MITNWLDESLQAIPNQPATVFDVTIIPISRRWIWPPVPSKNDKSGHYAAGESDW